MATDLDRLFREKLDQVEATPSPASWEQVQSQVTRKKAFWLVPVLPRALAAAVAIIVIASWVIWNNNSVIDYSESPIVSIDHPVRREALIPFKIPALKEKIPNTNTPKSQPKKRLSLPKLKDEIQKSKSFIPPILVARLDVNLDINTPINCDIPSLGVESEEIPSVKITYVASNQPTQPTTTTGKIGNFLSYLSKQGAPTEILADIRDAKDQIFSRN